MGDAYRDLERERLPAEVIAALKGMEEMEAEARAIDSKKVGFRVEAKFAEEGNAPALAAFLKGKLDETKTELERQAAQLAGTPMEEMGKKMLELLGSIHIEGEGKKGVLRGEAEPSAFPIAFLGRATVESGPPMEQFEEDFDF